MNKGKKKTVETTESIAKKKPRNHQEKLKNKILSSHMFKDSLKYRTRIMCNFIASRLGGDPHSVRLSQECYDSYKQSLLDEFVLSYERMELYIKNHNKN